MNDRAQRLLLWILAILLVGGTGLALRFARGYRPLAGLSPVPAFEDGANQPALRFGRITVSGRERGSAAWRVRAGGVEMTRERDRLVFTGGVTFDKLRPAPAGKKIAPPRTAWTLAARTAEVTGAQRGENANFSFSGGDLRARLLKTDGKTVAATLASPGASATYANQWRTLRLTGRPVVGNVGDLRIEAGIVDWTEDSHQVRCSGPVRATHPRGDLSGTDLTVNLDTHAATLQNAHGRFLVDDNDPTAGVNPLPTIGLPEVLTR